MANLFIGTAPAGAVGAVFALCVHLFFRRRRGAGLDWPVEMRCAVEPYVVLLVGVMASILTIRLVGGEHTPWHYLGSPAFWLPVAVLVAARSDMGVLRESFRGVLTTWLSVGMATGLFIVIGVLMATSGMSTQLAESLAGLGEAYLFAVPFLGALGGFITGSTSGANAMFAATQSQTIAALGAGPLPGLAIHNVTASLFTMASPARVQLAAKLCPDPPRTTPILLMLLSIDLAAAALLGAALIMTTAA